MISTKVATSIAKGSTAQAVERVVSATQKQLSGETPAFVLAFASTQQPLGQVMPMLKTAFGKSLVVGCSSAGEFTQDGERNGALSVFALAGDYKAHASIARGLRQDVEATVARAASELPTELAGFPHRTVLLILDGLSGVAEEAALVASAMLGEGTRLAGGAAGDDLKMVKTFVGLGEQVEDDALVLVALFSKKPTGIGVAHGHKPFSAMAKITRASNNIVHEIDGEPAFNAWVRLVKTHVPDVDVSAAALPQFFAKYEAALAAGSEFKVRAPLAVLPDGSMAFACGIPTGTVISVANSTPADQLKSARRAAKLARDQMGGAAVAGALVFDCVCRKAILTDQFSEAVRGLSAELGNVPIAGIETYGEIAADVGDMSGFHNTTSVVLAFPH